MGRKAFAVCSNDKNCIRLCKPGGDLDQIPEFPYDENILCLNPGADLDWIPGFPYDENILCLNSGADQDWIPGFPYDEKNKFKGIVSF